MAEKDLKVLITGDASGLSNALGQASKASQGAAKEMEAAIGGLKNLLAGFAAPLAALAAVFGGGRFLKTTIEETKSWTVEAQKLARVLGITTEAASVLNLAIGDIYGDQEGYLAAVAKLTKSLNTNEDAFHRLGVETRDQNGRLRDTPSIMAEVNQALAGMKAGTDRNVASSQIYGKSWLEAQRYLKLTPEVMQAAQEKAEKLNLVVGVDAVEATNAYRASLNDLEDTIKGLKVKIGSELMPVMTQLNNDMSENGPAVVGFLGDLFSAVYQVILGAREQMEKAINWIDTGLDILVDRMKTYWSQAKAAATGNLSEVEKLEKDYFSRRAARLQEAKGDREEIEDRYAGKMQTLLGLGPKKKATSDTSGGAAPDGGTRDESDPYAAFEAKIKAEAALRKERLASWEKHQADMYEIMGSELDREEKKINDSHDEMLRREKEFGASEETLQAIEVDREVKLQQARTEADAKESEKRRQIAQEEAEERRRVLEETGTAQQGFLDGLDQYLQRQGTVFQQWSHGIEQMLQGVENAFAQGFKGILTGQMTFSQGLRSIWQGISGAIIQMLAQMAAKWLVGAIAANIFAEASSDAAKEQAVAQQESAASTLWATYSGIPFVGPAIAAGFIALMNASLIANAASAQGIVGAANGGWFDRPTLTMIGEGPRPELVVPDVAFRDFATNLAGNILAQERQVQGYGRMAAGYATPTSSASPLHLTIQQNAPIWDPSQRGLRGMAENFVDSVRTLERERSVVLRPGAAAFGGI